MIHKNTKNIATRNHVHNNGQTWSVCIGLDSFKVDVAFNTVLYQNDWDWLSSVIGLLRESHTSGSDYE